MSYYSDLGQLTMVTAGDHVRAIGWLHPNHPYTQGDVPAELLIRLKTFVQQSHISSEELGFGSFGGFHTCEFCRNSHLIQNFGVPSGQLLYVAPEMIVHYIEHHGYCPPDEFIAALMKSPLPDSDEYRLITEPFWHIQQALINRMHRLQEPDEPR